MLKKEGDPIAKDEVIAETRPWIKWFKNEVKSSVDGTVETVSQITGQVLLRHPPRPVDVTAYINGTIVEVRANEGATIETEGAFVQGIFGVGGEVSGEIAFACDAPDEVIGADRITGAMFSGKIVVAGELITSELYERAASVGVSALICGGLHDGDLRELLGYDIGVAITGHEPIRPILIVTEGFGPIAMARATFELLEANAGRYASANGATQIRAGVLRPEIIIPAEKRAPAEAETEHGTSTGLTAGSPIRIIREPDFGRIGIVKALPTGVAQVESEARVRVLEVEFENGETAIVPRSNVEAIERW